jgi:hypothetical protein
MTTPTVVVISCFFGVPESLHIYPACPSPHTSFYFFTNFEPLCQVAHKAGWIPRFIDEAPLNNDPLVCALQSKRVKFLTCLKDKPDRINTTSDYILYVDHKLFMQDVHVQQLVRLHKQQAKESAVLIRFHESPHHKTVWDEVNAARAQERYARHMDKTVATLQECLSCATKQYKAETQIYNTGLLLYYKPQLHNIQPLLDQVYDACIQGQQPECQVWWALYVQKYRAWCQGIPFNDLQIVWMPPEQYAAMTHFLQQRKKSLKN